MSSSNWYLGGGFTYFLFSPRKLGKVPILTSIFFKGVETTNQLVCFIHMLAMFGAKSLQMIFHNFSRAVDDVNGSEKKTPGVFLGHDVSLLNSKYRLIGKMELDIHA